MILGYGYCVKGCIIRVTHCHYVKLNNKYMIDYETKISIHIIYFDFNNQYIGVLSEQPPYKGFKYVEDLSVKDLNTLKICQCLLMTLSLTMTKTVNLVIH